MDALVFWSWLWYWLEVTSSELAGLVVFWIFIGFPWVVQCAGQALFCVEFLVLQKTETSGYV
jgi:hypothetical protein